MDGRREPRIGGAGRRLLAARGLGRYSRPRRSALASGDNRWLREGRYAAFARLRYSDGARCPSDDDVDDAVDDGHHVARLATRKQLGDAGLLEREAAEVFLGRARVHLDLGASFAIHGHGDADAQW